MIIPILKPLLLFAAMCAGLSLAGGGPVPARTPSGASRNVVPTVAVGRAKTASDDADADKADGTDLGIAFSVIAGIALLGVFLIVLVLLWGVRIRRHYRRETTEPTQHDPLWYLRTGKRRPKQDSTPSDPEESPDDKREPGRDDSD